MKKGRIELIALLIVGAVAGWAVDELFLGDRYGLLGNIILGVVGAFVGGFIFDRLGGPGRRGFIFRVIVAIIGAAVALLLYSLFKNNIDV